MNINKKILLLIVSIFSVGFLMLSGCSDSDSSEEEQSSKEANSVMEGFTHTLKNKYDDAIIDVDYDKEYKMLTVTLANDVVSDLDNSGDLKSLCYDIFNKSVRGGHAAGLSSLSIYIQDENSSTIAESSLLGDFKYKGLG